MNFGVFVLRFHRKRKRNSVVSFVVLFSTQISRHQCPLCKTIRYWRDFKPCSNCIYFDPVEKLYTVEIQKRNNECNACVLDVHRICFLRFRKLCIILSCFRSLPWDSLVQVFPKCEFFLSFPKFIQNLFVGRFALVTCAKFDLTNCIKLCSAVFRPTKSYRYAADMVEVIFVGFLKKVNGAETASTRKALGIAENRGDGGVSSCDRCARPRHVRRRTLVWLVSNRPFKLRPTTTRNYLNNYFTFT